MINYVPSLPCFLSIPSLGYTANSESDSGVKYALNSAERLFETFVNLN